jgi:hypothetical protein
VRRSSPARQAAGSGQRSCMRGGSGAGGASTLGRSQKWRIPIARCNQCNCNCICRGTCRRQQVNRSRRVPCSVDLLPFDLHGSRSPQARPSLLPSSWREEARRPSLHRCRHRAPAAGRQQQEREEQQRSSAGMKPAGQKAPNVPSLEQLVRRCRCCLASLAGPPPAFGGSCLADPAIGSRAGPRRGRRMLLRTRTN